ncbi:MAG: aspartate aminotransferase family protein, partial [Planctomycetes bacterium]|nr:aspartate aminotransferase family protein [Planctomycetota bacterium]
MPEQPRYKTLIEELRKAFPQPVSDPMHDAYFVYSILQALDRVDNMKGQTPLLGQPLRSLPAELERASSARVPDAATPQKQVIEKLASYLEGMVIYGHPRSQVNVISVSSIASIVGAMLPTIYNPNLVWDENSQRFALAELEAAAMAAALVGYDPAAASGVFTFGGTGTLLYGVRIGLEKALPGSLRDGVREDAAVFASRQSHYSRNNVASWLGLGSRNVVAVKSGPDNAVRLDLLEEAARKHVQAGGKVAAFVATLGTTDAFGLDDIEGIVRIRDALVKDHKLPYRPHVHADAVIGWAWSVFNDYDFEANPMGFRPRTLRALAGAHRRTSKLHLADSVGIDFHKTGFCPYISSLFLVKDRADLRLLAREQALMPYLYQMGHHKPGTFTLETSRSGCGPMAALASLTLLGKEGFRALVGHMVEMAEVLREHLEGHGATTVLNGQNFGSVTLFRAYPDGVDTFSIVEKERTDPAFRDQLLAYNEYNREIYRYVHEEAMAGRGVMISLTDNYRHTDYGEPM